MLQNTTDSLITRKQPLLSHNNKINLLFWLGMTFSFAFSTAVGLALPKISVLLFFSSFVIVPYFISKVSSITFDSELKKFINKEGVPINAKQEINLFWIILLDALVIISIGLIMDSAAKYGWKLPSPVNFVVFCSIIFLIPTLYFMCTNCPIAILFKKDAWQVCENTSHSSGMCPVERMRRHSLSHSFRAGNIHYSSRRK